MVHVEQSGLRPFFVPAKALHMGLGNYGHATLHFFFLSVFQSHSSLFIKFFILPLTCYKSICSDVTSYKRSYVSNSPQRRGKTLFYANNTTIYKEFT